MAASAPMVVASRDARDPTAGREGPLEINVADSKHLQASRQGALGTRVFVSHPTNQTWEQTRQTSLAACSRFRARAAHSGARLVPLTGASGRILGELAGVGVQEVLLIAGDYPDATGPYSD
ncbi:MAG: hypothetical protein IPI20_20495 [Rhodoferax sp.]|nr:hypothetical protein [Rhodoferax sp.]